MQQFMRGRAKVKTREFYQGRPRKDGWELVEGVEFDFSVGWYMGEDDPYQNEWALQVEYNDCMKHPHLSSWYSEKDVEILSWDKEDDYTNKCIEHYGY